MPKLGLSSIATGYADIDALNANFDDIEDALDNTLSRDGSAPNAMEANLDMNSNRIVNLGDAVASGEPVTLRQLQAAQGLAAAFPSQTGHAGKYLGTDGTVVGWSAIALALASATGTLAIANGGTGATSAADARAALGVVALTGDETIAGTKTFEETVVAPSFSIPGAGIGAFTITGENTTHPSGAFTLDFSAYNPGTSIVSAAFYLSGDSGTPHLYTPLATTSGTSFDFAGIPGWVTKIEVVLAGVSLSGTDNLLVQVGDSGGLETTGYVSGATSLLAATQGIASSTTGFVILVGVAADLVHATLTLTLVDVATNTWVASFSGYRSGSAPASLQGGGSKSLTAALDRIRLLATGANTFDAGKVNVRYS